MPVQREYLSPNEIAELLGVSPFTIRRYIKLGELRAVKLLGGFRVHRDDLQRFLKAHEVNPAEEELLPEETAADKAPVDKPPVERVAPALPLPEPAHTPPPVAQPPASTREPAPRRPTTAATSSKKARGTSTKKSRRPEKT